MRLYIIGNGFDLNHGLKSSYIDYRNYLLQVNPGLVQEYESMEYMRIAECRRNELWSNLETALGLSYEDAFDYIVSNYYPDMNSEHTPGWDDINVEIENRFAFVQKFTRTYFFEWINQINSGIIPGNFPVRGDVDGNGRFITFNYTETLERIYGVPQGHVLHIHGRIDDDRSIQFGNPENDPKAMRRDLKRQYSGDEFYNAVIEPAIGSMAQYAGNAFKNLGSNMGRLSDFITSAGMVDEVVIMGHSFMGIDNEYYRSAVVPMCANAKWIIYAYGATDRQNARTFAGSFGIANYKIRPW